MAQDPGASDGLRVLGPLGRGAMGEVVRAFDPTLQREVALKSLQPRFADDPPSVERFVEEAQLSARLDHPGIVPVYRRYDTPGAPPAYSMKVVSGRTLRAWLEPVRQRAEAGKPQPAETALAARLELFCLLCEPIAFAHRQGVLHRDLKPDNVMVGHWREVYVMDWGVARIIGQPAPAEADQSVGTPAYLSPEQARAENAALDGRSDLYTLGVLLYELSTLRRARRNVKGPMVLAAARGHIDPVEPLGEPVSRELRAVIKKATAPAVADRYRDVDSLVADVRRVLRGEEVEALPDGPTQRLGRAVARHRERVAAALGALLLLGVAVLALLVSLGLVVRDLDRTRAADRSTAQLALGGFCEDRARALDRQLLRHEGLLRGLAATTSAALRNLDGDAPVFLSGDWSAPGAGPPDLARSVVYGGPASWLHADLVTAPGFDSTAGAARLTTLASLRDAFAEVLVQSGELGAVDPAAARDVLFTQGAPAVWAYVATADGALAGFPGVGSYPPDYDPRSRPWYHEALSRHAPGWGRPYVDESGLGLLVSCGMPLRDDRGALVAVAALDVTVKRLVADWLDPGARPAEVFLVDDQGLVVLRSGKNNAAVVVAPEPFPHRELWEATQGGPSGQIVRGGVLAAWSRLQAVPWTLVLVGGEDELLGD